MQQRAIRFTQDVALGDRLRNASTFADMLVGILTENLSEEYTPEELLAGPTWSGQTPRGWRYRVRELKFNLDALMLSENFTIGRAEDTIRGQLHAVRNQITQQVANADWQLVSWEADTRDIRRRARSKTEKARLAQKRWNKFSGEDKPSEHEEVFVIEQQVYVTLTFVDAAKQKEIDTWKERTGLPGGAFEDGSVPMSARKEYKAARDLISRFYAQEEPATGAELTAAEQRQYVADRAKGVSYKAITRAYAKVRNIEVEDVDWKDIRSMVLEAEQHGTSVPTPGAAA